MSAQSIVDRYTWWPRCHVCKEEWNRAHFVPGATLVAKLIVMREHPGRGYLAIVHCHGSSEVIELGTDLPTERALSLVVAFKGT